MGYLAIDVGGTKTEIGYFENLETILFKIEKRYESKKYESLEAIISDFIEIHQLKIEAIGVGIAGPIIEGVCHTTNLPWIVDQHKIIHHFNIKKCVLLNDLVANAYGIEMLKEEDLFSLQKGIQSLKGNRALISPGTGLGEAGLFFDGKNYHPFPTEGGHCDFAATDAEEVELFLFLKSKYSHVSYERILSGIGFSVLYDFYTQHKNLKKENEVECLIESERPQKITEMALLQKSETCRKVVDRFIRVLASEASNLALKLYALGGIYIGGGIAPKILPMLKTPIFNQAFKDKGRFHDWLNFMSITLIKDDKTALKGAAISIKRNY